MSRKPEATRRTPPAMRTFHPHASRNIWRAGTSADLPPARRPREQLALGDFAERVRSAVGSNLIDLRLFGSRARGDPAPVSDFDVLVVVGDDRVSPEDQVIDIAFDVNLDSDVYISPRVVTESNLRDPVWRATLFVRTREPESVPL